MENNNLFLRLFIRQTMTEGYEQFEKEMLKAEQTNDISVGAIEEQANAQQAKED